MVMTYTMHVFAVCFITLLCMYYMSLSFAETSAYVASLRQSFQSWENTKKDDFPWLPLMEESHRIAIVVVVEPNTELNFYQYAMLSMGCYARIWNYEYQIANSSNYWRECAQKDQFFRRHCIVARILTSFDYVLFLDADVGVVNPKRRIEEYIDPNAEIIFYDRFYNWEIAAGGYLVKNTDWAVEFLDGFANYEDRLPQAFHGTDNGALHAYVAEHIVRDRDTVGLARCLSIYERSQSYEDLFLYEACIRSLLGNGTDFGKIKILKKGTAWVRDNWMTNSLWSPERDFMMHNWKNNQLRTYDRTPLPISPSSNAEWYNPLAGPINMSLCVPGNTSWSYDYNLLQAREIIDNRLSGFAADVEKSRNDYLNRLANYSLVSTLRFDNNICVESFEKYK